MVGCRTLVRRLINLVVASQAMIRYGLPQRRLVLVGITGTDGKTTTAHLTASILQAAGCKTGYISTLGADIDGRQLDTGLHTSTPGPADIYYLLSQMKQAGVSHVVIETTSHGLDQYRTFGLTFAVGLITNISPEHLDYHQTMAHYIAAKAKIIDQSKQTIVNIDSQPLLQLAQQQPSVKTFSLNRPADFQAAYQAQSSSLSLLSPPIQADSLHLPLPGQYNAANALAAIAIAVCLDVPTSAIAQGLTKVTQLDGRWQLVQDQPFTVIIDFAHTPQALAQVLPQAKQLTAHKGRLIHVFGSAAQRDQTKRADMGSLSGQWADYTILTMEDPRYESLDTIQAMITQGLQQQGRQPGQHWQRLDDRQQAIDRAISMAQPGDVVLITGKGHEHSLAVQGRELPWSDLKAVHQSLNQQSSANNSNQ